MTVLKKYRVVCLSALLSSILFLKLNVDFFDYIFVAIAFLVFLLLSYPVFWKNRNLGSLFVCIAIPNLIAYLLLKLREGYGPVWDVMDFFFTGYAVILAIILIFVLVKRKDLENCKENLFEYRERELDELEKRLQDSNIIGIDAAWGDGKSFLLQLFAQKQKEVKKKNRKEKEIIHIINISVMSSTIETIESYIISEISTFLEENMVFSYSSQKIKKFFSQPLLKNWSFFFDEKNSYSELFGSLVRDVKTVGKKIALSFEDLERIRDDKIILKVFNIAEKIDCECKKIGCECIKIIYQYDKKELIDVLKIEQKPNFLEKYIPVELRLTPIPLIDAIKAFVKKYQYKNINDEDFSFLGDDVNLAESREKLNIATSKLKISCYSLRKIRLFISEIESLLNKEEFKANKKTVIVFFVAKYFYPSLFLQIEFGRSLMNTISLTLNEDGKKTELKLSEFTRRFQMERDIYERNRDKLEAERYRELDKKTQKKEIEKIYQEFKIRENKLSQDFESSPLNWDSLIANNYEPIWFLYNLGYYLESFIFRRLSIEQKEKNDSIDSIVWKLKYMGSSGRSKGREVINEIEKIIDSQDDIELKRKKYINLLLKTKQLENFREGTLTEEEILFALMNIYVKDSAKWRRIIEFYIQCRTTKFIDYDIFPVFKQFKISSKEIFFIAANAFISLDVNTRFDKINSYLYFLQSYLEQIKIFGFFSEQNLYEDCFRPYNYSEDLSMLKKLQQVLLNIIDEVKNVLFQNKKVSSIADECDVVIRFIEKNIELINAPMKAKESKDSEKNDKNVKVYHEFLRFNSEKELNEWIGERYKKNKVSLEEISKIRALFEKEIAGRNPKIKQKRISKKGVRRPSV